MDLGGYIRQARRLPLKVILRKAARLAVRTGRARLQLASDVAKGSYSGKTPGLNPAARIAIVAADIPADLVDTLRTLSGHYLEHRFDLLGSGWVRPAYRFEAPGFLGRRYAPGGPAAPGKAGAGLEAVVNRSNVPRASEIWSLIAGPGYKPVDWQLDFRSGYRWSAQTPSLRLSIPTDAGADVKVPWELARLQHLPQLALCAILANAGAAGFAPAARYVAEISNQLADFLATNPPRFGVNWIGAMDVAIRAANIALTLALLRGAGLELPAAICAVVAGSLDEHARHVIEHLDYSETGRSNHYLANLGGLVWSNWALVGDEVERRLVFAVAALLNEAELQFLSDGGNYEGSTNYHRLSGETVLFSLAVIASLTESALSRMERMDAPRNAWRGGFPVLPLPRHRDVRDGRGLIAPALLSKVAGAVRLSRAVQGQDHTIVQIGDTDSGRFFKLHPALIPGQQEPVENTLDHRGFIAAGGAFFGVPDSATFDAMLVTRLFRNGFAIPPEAPIDDFGDIDVLLAQWDAAPEEARRVRRLPFSPSLAARSWARAAFPDFGLYVFRNKDRLVAFRCAGAPPPNAPRGHRHDDNLAIEYRLGPQDRRDPGSYVYTPDANLRNRYRSAQAHDVPRLRGVPLTRFGDPLFDLDEIAHARCLCWRADAVAGEVSGPFGSILRIVRFTSDALEIYDCTAGGTLEEISAAEPVARGYGRL